MEWVLPCLAARLEHGLTGWLGFLAVYFGAVELVVRLEVKRRHNKQCHFCNVNVPAKGQTRALKSTGFCKVIRCEG